MSSVGQFEFILLLLVAILGLRLLAGRLGLPPAAALIMGGMGLAFVPGVPTFDLDPDLVLVLFLPPLLMDGAYYTVWREFRRNLAAILQLAIGAVLFTTLAVGVVTHMLVPHLPWAVCFALGAVVSPPDAVAAKAVLEHVTLPRRLVVLLEGESLLNDAAGLVLFRFAIAAALTGAFSLGQATLAFTGLAVGGVIVGGVLGYLWIRGLRLLKHEHLTITAIFMLPWAAYILGEAAGVSGVIATVAAGLVLGWHQHEVFTASVRLMSTAAWQVMVFVLEALVFILIGLSLRGVMSRLGGVEHALGTLAVPVLAVLGTVVAARFLWVFAAEGAGQILGLLVKRRPLWSPASALLLSWAGMRGVVTLAVALSIPTGVPGRDLILAAAFAVILGTVLIQGSSLGPLIRWLGLDKSAGHQGAVLTAPQAMAAVAAAQLEAVRARAHNADGSVRHPRLLEQYTHRARVAERYSKERDVLSADRSEHYDVILATIAAGRTEVLRLHRTGRIHDDVLHVLEYELDLQEMAASTSRMRLG
ncbi:Na+/H+ antiporter [Nitrospirillum amazonense]|uniref:Sodium/proton antiporter (CPA1 family) n=1 Tax=Nitrospirillum amazonense TaxID=28077 RepID=A0A560JUM2_9PROT|nr:Na+/H+ antiporter [Nitrospirillum amazonense]MDG3442941.1 Na+/H+ antiporter [Nitrospirillum amazonense]TWB72010.1 sodium/proton antiporter (CPA1 family) [Nitrospirillum amazonense]